MRSLLGSARCGSDRGPIAVFCHFLWGVLSIWSRSVAVVRRAVRDDLCRYGCRALVRELLAVHRSRHSPRVLWACVQIIFETVQVEELAGKLCKPAASLLLPATLAAAL